MNPYFNNSIFSKFFWGFMALYFLNCSVDAPDHFFKYENAVSPINDQESIVELVVEKVLGFESAIADCDNNDASQKTHLKKPISLDFFVIANHSFQHEIGNLSLKRILFSIGNSALLSRQNEIHSPPPES